MLSFLRVLCCALFLLAFTAARTGDPAAGAGCSVGANQPGPPPLVERPNIVIILSDDAAYNESSLSGNRRFPTPRMQQLASSSMSFSNGYVTAPECSPSRAGMLTGRYPQRFGFERNILDEDDEESLQGLPPDEVLLSDTLSDLGYTTGIVGKWHLGVRDGENRPVDSGFQKFFGFLTGQREYWGWLWWAFDKMIMRGNEPYPAWLEEGDPSTYDTIISGRWGPIEDSRYLTDAFGDEAEAFIEDHHDEENPFFLYLAFNAVHQPSDAKLSDLDAVSGLAHSHEAAVSAMTYAMDRAVGQVLDRLDDPNGDGDPSDSIAENTIVVFTNDNGGVAAPYFRDNRPFRGWKHHLYEGGIRVPFMIRDPRLGDAGRGVTYDQPISTLDLFPTLVAAAGGRMTTPTDGVDLFPHLNGDNPDAPHEVLRWRKFDEWAIRQGDWKLVAARGFSSNSLVPELYDLGENPGEFSSENMASSHPEIVQELHDELTAWESELAKPEWGRFSSNAFVDGFRYADAPGAHFWSEARRWIEADVDDPRDLTLGAGDAYANAILEFPVNNTSDYTATNNLRRMTRNTFMLNELRFSGHFESGAGTSATIDGNQLLMVRSQAGKHPELVLSATGSGPEAYTFFVDNDIELMHDLEISGDGTEHFALYGNITSFASGRALEREAGIVKTGDSSVVLAGINSYTGSTRIHGGELVIDGEDAAISGTGSVSIRFGGALSLLAGELVTPILVKGWWSDFHFLGGTLAAGEIWGHLRNQGGTFAPGMAAADSTIWGGYSQDSGVLRLQIRESRVEGDFDQIDVRGLLRAGGTLQIVLDGYVPRLGDRFELVTARWIQGDFALESPKGSDGEDIFSLRTERGSVIAEVVSI